jgi:molybdate/tungstate transport system permease protein
MKNSDLFTASCIIFGSFPVLLIIAGLFVLTSLQCADPKAFIEAVFDPSVLEAIIITFSSAAGATLILAIFGTPLAFLLARKTFPGKAVIEGLIDLPLILPHTVAGIIVFLLFMHTGIIGSTFLTIGIRFEESIAGIIVAMFFVSIPYYVNTVRDGFIRVPIRMEYVARSLGATPGTTFLVITLPLTYRHILTGGLTAWGRGVSEFAAVVMIAYHPMIIPTLIYQRFSTGGLYTATAVAFVMVLFSLGLFICIRLLSNRIIGAEL